MFFYASLFWFKSGRITDHDLRFTTRGEAERSEANYELKKIPKEQFSRDSYAIRVPSITYPTLQKQSSYSYTQVQFSSFGPQWLRYYRLQNPKSIQ